MSAYVYDKCSNNSLAPWTTVSGHDPPAVKFYAFDPATCQRSEAYACVVPQTIDSLSRVVPNALSLAFCMTFFVVAGMSRWFYKRGSDKCQCFNYVWFTFDHVLSSAILATVQVICLPRASTSHSTRVVLRIICV